MKTSFIFTVNQIPKKWNKKTQSYCSHKYLNNKRTFCAVLVHCLLESSSHLRCSVRKNVLKNFPVNFAKFLKTPFFQNTSEQLVFSYFLVSLFTVKKNFYPVKTKSLMYMSTLLRKFIYTGKPFNWESESFLIEILYFQMFCAI